METSKFMRAGHARSLLGITVWDFKKMVLCGTLRAIYPLGRFSKTVSKRKLARKRGSRLPGERKPYYLREDVEKLGTSIQN